MAAPIWWIGGNERVPRRKIRDFLNSVEFYDGDTFSKSYRFSKEYVIRLNKKIEPAIRHGSDQNAAIPPILQLLTSLRFYATGCFQMVNGDLFGVHKSTVSRIVGRVSQAIAALKNQYQICSNSRNICWILQKSWFIQKRSYRNY